ncbi:MAG: CHRD domain-containing protein, partial [Planctomycetota bacterium]|nr:CHRD domain-containing protein [Planctomycetota bacterium]
VTAPTITQCAADQSAGSLSVAWDPGTSVMGYEVSVNGNLEASLAGDQTSFDFTPSLVEGRHNPFVIVVTAVPEPGAQGDDLSSSCSVTVSGGNVFFADDFEAYADDTALETGGYFIQDENMPEENAAWTVTNPGNRINPPNLLGLPTFGRFVISDSDDASGSNPTGSGQSHDLWSPSFSTAGNSSVWLHLDISAQLNNNGEAVFDVDVSTDGGANWSNVFRRVAPDRSMAPLPDNSNTDGYYGQLDVDLSSAADQAAVKFRLRHFEPNDDWWIAVDNVIVDDVAPLQGGSQVLFAEDFSAGLGAMTALSLEDTPNVCTETWNALDKAGRFTPGSVAPRGVNRLGHPGRPENSFTACLSGDQGAPDPVDTAASGSASFTYDPGTRELSFDITFSGLSSPESNAHIHDGDFGVAGGVIHPLPAGSPKVGSVTLSEAEEARLLAGGLYVNIHSDRYPSGEIRGQIVVPTGFAILESDANPDPDEDELLLTPSIDATDMTEVFLHYDSETVVSGSVQEVLVSVDGGQSFEQLFTYRGGLVDNGEDPFYARRVFSVPQAAGQSDVLFAFHWVGRNDWWWAVDNVQVTGTPADTGTGLVPGDANSDGVLDLSDGVRILEKLFTNRDAVVPCAGDFQAGGNFATLNFNGDPTVDLTDAVLVFTHLFLDNTVVHVLGTACVLIADCERDGDVCSP